MKQWSHIFVNGCHGHITLPGEQIFQVVVLHPDAAPGANAAVEVAPSFGDAVQVANGAAGEASDGINWKANIEGLQWLIEQQVVGRQDLMAMQVLWGDEDSDNHLAVQFVGETHVGTVIREPVFPSWRVISVRHSEVGWFGVVERTDDAPEAGTG